MPRIDDQIVCEMSDAPSQDSLWPDTIHAYDVTMSTPARNLALDEALLERVNAEPSAACLRTWRPEQLFVVLGRSNQEQTEVNLEACVAAGIPVFRRASGGGTVIVGPGCLCYSLVLPLRDAHRSLGVSRVTAGIMSHTAAALSQLLPGIEVRGTSDLALNGSKFSGNAQRWLRKAFIHHGTLLSNFDLSLCETFLKHPSREPDYRHSRRHLDFITNIPLTVGVLQDCLSSTWHAVPAEVPNAVLDEAVRLAAARYESHDWNNWRRS